MDEVFQRYQDIDDENNRNCAIIHDALVEIDDHGPYSIDYILNHAYFKCLSEDNKEQVFRGLRGCFLDHIHWKRRQSPCLNTITKYDRQTYLEQLLPYMPLHKFKSCSLPSDLPWIESEEWMRAMLMKYKVRWNPDSNNGEKESNVQKGSDIVGDTQLQNDEDVMADKDTIEKLCNLAFTMLAADLFYVCCQSNAIRCCEYLLRIAPNLVAIEIPGGFREEAVALCSALMFDRHDLVRILLEQQAPIGNIAQSVYLIFWHSSDSRSLSFITKALNRRENRDEVRLFRDKHGNSTILHLLLSQLFEKGERRKIQAIQYLLECIQRILDFGVDPLVMNGNKETTLDVFIDRYLSSHQIPLSMEIIYLQTLNWILPSWGVALPSDFFPQRETDKRDRVIMMCKITELLNDEHTFKFAIYSIVKRYFFVQCNPNDCWLCRPVVSMMYRAMCKGIDLQYIPWQPLLVHEMRELAWKAKDYVSFLLMNPESMSCCRWALLELLVHLGNDAFSRMEIGRNPDEGRLVSHVHHLCGVFSGLVTSYFEDTSRSYTVDKIQSYTVDKIRSILVMLNMYSPSILQALRPELLAYRTDDNIVWLRRYLHQTEKTMKEELMMLTIEQIPDTFERVRPLKLLCRLKIRDNVNCRDVEALPLPGKLKHYVRIGDIPENHVLHQIIEEMKATK